jgi:hypothetical protein
MNTTDPEHTGDKPSSPHRHDGPLVKLLLRNYAKNLRRSWRNTPHAAFVDATIQVEGLAAVGLGLVFMLIEILVSRTFLPLSAAT